MGARVLRRAGVSVYNDSIDVLIAATQESTTLARQLHWIDGVRSFERLPLAQHPTSGEIASLRPMWADLAGRAGAVRTQLQALRRGP